MGRGLIYHGQGFNIYTMGRGFSMPSVGDSMYHRQGIQYTMDKRFNILWVGIQYTMGRSFDIPLQLHLTQFKTRWVGYILGVGFILTPLFLENCKSYAKSIGIAHTGILQENSMAKIRITKLSFWMLVPFEPFYLRHLKSLVKSELDLKYKFYKEHKE